MGCRSGQANPIPLLTSPLMGEEESDDSETAWYCIL